MKKRDVIIVGGGASGICCAINLKRANKNLSVTVLEQNDKILKKLLKTGNGKCNIGNENITKDRYHNFDFFKENIPSFDIKKYFLDMGILLKKDEIGRLYPYCESASNVVDILRNEADRLKVEVITEFTVTDIKKTKLNYEIYGKENYQTNVLVLACGSIAQSHTNGYELARNLNHTVTDLKAGLTPIKVKEDVKSLQGIRIKCRAIANDFARDGEILFKENGISGILSLELSRYVSNNDKIVLDLVPNVDEKYIENFIENKAKSQRYDRDSCLLIALSGMLPKMLSLLIIKKSKNIEEIVKNIKNLTLTVDSLYGFNNSQIVVGGVDIKDIYSTFESKINNNLFIIGEMLDVDGDCGGYNLYFAWLSAYICSNSIIKENFTKS